MGESMRRMRQWIIWLGVVSLIGVVPVAWAVERVALVIGNDRYEREARLTHAVSDAKTVGDALQALGFTVLREQNLNMQGTLNALSKLNRVATGASWVVIYYAGHGIQVNSKNYLIPVNVALNRQGDLYRTVPLDALLTEVNQAQELGLILLDSCRNNPFVARLNQGAGRSVATRGLARVDSTGGNTLVAFATREGDIAADSGVYATALAAQLKNKPERDIRQLLGGVRDQVMRQTNQRQQPFTYGSLGGGHYAFVKPAVSPTTPSSTPLPPPSSCCQLWVRTTPDGAKVRIMDIVPTYQHGIEVQRGKHRIRVEAAGHQPHDEWHEIAQAQQVVMVDLKPIQVAQVTTPTPFKPPVSEPAPAAGSTPRALQVFRDTLSDGTRGPSMVVIPAGEFWMGSPESEKGRDSDEHRHKVSVSIFAMGQYEVTFAEYDRFCDATGRDKPKDRGWGRGKRPVIYVSWHDAVAYADWLSKETGKKYRLPTEAEWEYAARAGTSTAYWWGNRASHEYANYGQDECCGGLVQGKDRWKYTAPVGSFDPNSWKLYDTTGNVYEWTCSKYDKNYGGDERACISNNRARDPRALRGGSWGDDPAGVRSADRTGGTPGNRTIDVGFRLARSL